MQAPLSRPQRSRRRVLPWRSGCAPQSRLSPLSPLKFTITSIIWVTVLTMTVADPVPGIMLGGLSFAPLSVATYVIEAA